MIAVALVAFTALGEPAVETPSPVGPPSFATPTRPPAGSVYAYYEILDADGALLYERVLDGMSLPRLIVERPSSDFSRTYTVDPLGKAALATFSSADRTSLEAIDVATGSTLWVVETPILEPESGVWSADGRRWAALVAEVDFEAGPSVLIADLASGGTAVVALDERAWPQGFTASGELVLTERDEDPRAEVPWRFLAVDAATGGIVRLATPPPVGPHSVATDDVAPAAGLGVGYFLSDEGTATVEVRELGSGSWRHLAEFEFVDRLVFSPQGDVVAANADGTVALVELDGSVTELWDGPDYSDLSWSASGRYLGVSGWQEDPVVAIVERASGRVVELPLPDEIAEGRLVGVVGDGALPTNPLPPGGDPAPSPLPEPTGPPIVGAASVAVGWIEVMDTTSIAHAEIRVPTEDGGVRTTATMPPIELEELQGMDLTLTLSPRPGSPEILVAIDADEVTMAWLWDPAAGRRPFPFPDGWPAAVSQIHWRSDGAAIASTTLEPSTDPLVEPAPIEDAVVVVAELDTSIVRQFPLPEGYPTLEGWWSIDELRMGREVCIEECAGRFPYVARLRLSDGALRPFTAGDRPPTPIHVPLVDFDPDPVITLDSVRGLATDDVTIDWPTDLPPIDGSIAVWATSSADLLVAAPVEGSTALYRISDPLGRERNGRLGRPNPTFVASLPILAQDPSLSPDGRWLLVRDRAGGTSLVDLGTDSRRALGPTHGGHLAWLQPQSADAS
jgi:hypothetical protein